MLTPSQTQLVHAAYQSMVKREDGLVALSDLMSHYNASEHPAVKRGDMAPSAARDTLQYQFGECSKDHNGCVTLDEFIKYHEKVADEAHTTRGGDVNAFIDELIMRLWRLGDLLAPTFIRPVFSVDEMPSALYGKTLMCLVWPGVDENGESFLHCIRDAVQPIFRRGDLPPQIQGFFAFPAEFMGFRIKFVAPQISVKRWLDFVWEYAEGRFAAVEGVISARVAKDSIPPYLRDFIQEHDDTKKLPYCQFLERRITSNPMYKKSSESYGYKVVEECRKIHNWKLSSMSGKEYGLQYHGLIGRFFSTNGPSVGNAATGINM